MPNRISTNTHKGFYQKPFFIFSLLSLVPWIITDIVHASETTIKSKQPKIEPITDLRVIVDISGSMKKTDPNNLRRPAIRLLAGLIPQGSRAGIWNFGKQVNMAVKIATVNDEWRDQARKKSNEINSVGLYTNIESAMRKVSFDWKEPDPRYKRNLILLTDGHVDISDDDREDKASRKRILKEIIPVFEKAKIRIHTIALSDDVDERLLSTLSAYTDGLYKKVSSADDLQKLFLQMLEQSVKLDTIPLKDNRFNVDASVNDMTLLIFNKDKLKPTKLVTPGKKTWDQKIKPNDVKWFSDQGFDLITIKKPQQGQWKIFAPVDKNNRVVVATNLKLKINELPSFAMLGDVLNVNAQLQEDGMPLSNEPLLSKFKFTLMLTKEGSDELLYPLHKLAKDETTYSAQLPPIFKPGNNSIVIQAKSPTAEREIHHNFTVYNVPASVRITEEDNEFKVIVTPHENLVRPESIKITAKLEEKNRFILVQHDKDWVFNVDKKYKNKVFTLNFEGVRADGKKMSVNFNKVLEARDNAQALMLDVKNPANKKTVVLKENINEIKEIKKPANKNKKEMVKEESKPEINWKVVIVSVVVGNIILIVMLGGGYIYIKRRKIKLAKNMQDEMNEDESSDKVEKSESKDE